MHALSLTLAGRVADLPANLKGLVRLTQARAALADLESRKGEYTWLLTLPATRTNARIFGINALHPQGLDKFLRVDCPYELRCDGQIFAGTFRLSSLKGGYTGQLLGAGFSWALLLGEKKLTDLRFPEVPYDGTQLASILDMDCDTSDLQFPLLSFGNFYHPPVEAIQPDGSTKEVPSPPAAVLDWPLSVDDYPASVYLVNTLRQIFKEIGWSLSGRVLDEPQWRETVLTCCGADVAQAWPWGALLPAEATGTGATCFSYLASGPGTGFENNAVGFAEDAPCGNIDGLDLGGEVFYLPVAAPQIISGGTRAMNGPLATYIGPVAGVYGFAYSAELQNGHQTYRYPFATGSQAQLNRFLDVKLALLVRRGAASFTGEPLNGQPVDAQVVPHFVQLAGFFDANHDVIPQQLSGMASGVYLEAGDSVQLCVIGRRKLVDLGNGRVLMERAEFVLNFGAVRFACTSYADNDGVSKVLAQPSAFLPPLLQKDVVKAFLKQTDTVLIEDVSTRTVSLLSRAEQTISAGPAIDLSSMVDPATVEYSPAAGAGIGTLMWTGPEIDDPLLTAGSDTVRVSIGPASGQQTVTGLFAPMAYRSYRLRGGALASIATATDQSSLDTNRDETAWDIPAQAPRLVRYTGPDASLRIPFGTGTLPLATSAWDGALAWAGEAGAVATYYAGTVQQALHGHLAKLTANLTPALYTQLCPGRAVHLFGAPYRLDAANSYDLADEANQTEVILLRQL